MRRLRGESELQQKEEMQRCLLAVPATSTADHC